MVSWVKVIALHSLNFSSLSTTLQSISGIKFKEYLAHERFKFFIASQPLAVAAVSLPASKRI